MTHKNVPIEPTDSMLAEIDLIEGFTKEALKKRYKAMLSAAPPDNTVQELREQLNEADRRAGAAERQMQSYVSECQSRKDWIRKAKEEWGVDNSVSFDVVWKEALQLREQVAELVEALEDVGEWINTLPAGTKAATTKGKMIDALLTRAKEYLK